MDPSLASKLNQFHMCHYLCVHNVVYACADVQDMKHGLTLCVCLNLDGLASCNINKLSTVGPSLVPRPLFNI